MESSPKHFTARRLAECYGISERAMRDRLAMVPPSALIPVRGQKTNAWAVATLPEEIRSVLARRAEQGGHTSIEAYLAPVVTVWRSPLPWHQISEPFRKIAQARCEALAGALEHQHQWPDFLERANIAWRQHFGSLAPADKLRYLCDRATKRDGGLMQFHRPELYLDDEAFAAKPAPEVAPVATLAKFPALEDVLAKTNKATPSLEDRERLFHYSFQWLESLWQERPSRGEIRSAKVAVVEYLYQHVPALYRPQAVTTATPADRKPLLALRRIFNEKHGQWVAGGRRIEALRDQRLQNSGRVGYQCPECEKKIHDLAVHLRGREGKQGAPRLAYQMLRRRNELCPKCVEHWTYNPRQNKSYMARTLLERVTPNILTVAKTKGKRAVRQAAPPIMRDWREELPGDWMVADDETPNFRTWQNVELDGEHRVLNGLFQALHMHDAASFNPLHLLTYIGAPNQYRIKQLCKESFLPRLGGVGLPRKGVIFEGGAFQARLVAGDNSRNALDFQITIDAFDSLGVKMLGEQSTPERERGIRDGTGLHIHHARTPGAKPIERSFYSIQNLLSHITAGNKGFDERRESSQAMQDFTRRVEAGQEHPGNEWMELSVVTGKIREALEEFANTPQNGRLRGRSPREVWNEALERHPLKQLPEEMEYVLATHKKLIERVGNEIKVKLGTYELGHYWSAELLQRFGGRRALVFWSVNYPQFIVVTDAQRQNPLIVPRAQLPAMTATPEQLRRLQSERTRLIQAATTVHGKLSHPLKNLVQRDADHPENHKALGRFIEDAQAKQVEETKTRRAASSARAAAGAALRARAAANLTSPTTEETIIKS